MSPSKGGSAGLSEKQMADNEQNSHPEPNPEAVPQPEDSKLATPLETAIANAQALEAIVGKMAQELNERRIQLLKWQGAAEFLASLEHPAGSGNGEDKESKS